MKSLDKAFEVLGIKIGNREYAVDIGTVEIIVETPEIARVPNSKDLMKGVMNLRGRIVPVIDTNKLTNSSGMTGSNVIVTKVDDSEVGFLVDGVTEVMWVKPDEFDTTMKMGGSNYMKGVIMKGQRLMSLIDLSKVVLDEMGSNIQEV